MDGELVKKCIAGNASSYKTLYERYASKMLGVCLRYAGNREEAEDLLHDSFIKIFHHLHQYNTSGPLDAWMRRIVVNTAIDGIRRKKLEYSPVEVETLDNQLESDQDVAGTLGFKELVALIQELSPGYRLVFNLYVVEGYQHSEIANLLQISEGTSKSQLARARQILRTKITSQNDLTQSLAVNSMHA